MLFISQTTSSLEHESLENFMLSFNKTFCRTKLSYRFWLASLFHESMVVQLFPFLYPPHPPTRAKSIGLSGQTRFWQVGQTYIHAFHGSKLKHVHQAFPRSCRLHFKGAYCIGSLVGLQPSSTSRSVFFLYCNLPPPLLFTISLLNKVR